jgi:gluconate 2-dehydrogenase gamma chain
MKKTDRPADPSKVTPQLTRRGVLSGTLALGSSAALSGAQARSISGGVPWQPAEANAPVEATPTVPGGAWQFFTAAERDFIDAAVSRLIPNDELGPGAKEAGVTVFLDRQLAGAYGQGASWYMQGPWQKGEETQGYQSRMSPAEIYRAAIKAIDAHCAQHYDGKTFAGLSDEQKDEVLTGLEKKTISLEGADAGTFFTLILQNTTEGFFSDPIYGGNRDMVGWKLIGFPGARYDYRPYVKRHGEKLDLAPVGIKGRPGWTPA